MRGEGLLCRCLRGGDGDHPRVCGEKMSSCASWMPSFGSPPRVRGEEDISSVRLESWRITPACAGRRLSASLWRLGPTDHPRVCGEKFTINTIHPRNSGSPPRVRGEAGAAAQYVAKYGITPACAGRSLQEKPTTATNGDHPRVCGEKISFGLRINRAQGSPPRVRGEDTMPEQLRFRHGITPACAGRRLCNAASCRLVEDHPRVCGEKLPMQKTPARLSGSPPRVRGEAGGDLLEPLLHRITPACAGRSSAKTRCTCLSRDHPRVCGEKKYARGWTFKVEGSPPRVRGEAPLR